MKAFPTVKRVDEVKCLKIVTPRLPLNDCTNSRLLKTNTKEQTSTKKSPTKKENNSKQTDNSVGKCEKPLFIVVANNEIPSQQKANGKGKINLKKGNIKSNPNNNYEDHSNTNNKHLKEFSLKPNDMESNKVSSFPISKRLRRGNVKNYLESTLEDTTIHSTPEKAKMKIPIYQQQIPMTTKTNSKDPYALDIVDTNDKKQKKKRSSAKFNKTMYNIMEKIEKKERANKKKVVKKVTNSYEEKIQNVMKKVLQKHENHNSVSEMQDNITSHNIESPRISIGKEDKNEEFLSTNQLNNTKISTESITNLSIFSNNQNLGKSKQINILSNVSLEPIQNSITEIINHSNLNLVSKDAEPNRISETSEIDPLNKSHNLYREFNGDITLFNNQTTEENCEFSFTNDVSDTETVDNGFFGFQDDNEEEISQIRRYPLKRKAYPWRFEGYFKRNPHILKLKKNGLPCKEQEMVLNYEFVKRIEALCSTKSIDSSYAKNPVQTTILDYVERSNNYQNEPIRPSLFDYEEFNIAKVPRKVLGIMQNNKVVSTPTKSFQAVVISPNISVIPSDENEENIDPRSPKKNNQKKCCPKMKNRNKDNQDILDEDILPSILEDNLETPKIDDVHLFEDFEKNTEFSIKLPVLRYGQNRRRKRQISEGSGDEEEGKISAKKKKNMMTKAEEIEFNAWADKMNARFAEDDKHELTIE